jgi:hypothetical protein
MLINEDDQLNLFPEHVSLEPNCDTKVCKKCGETLPLSAYSFSGGGKYRRTECKRCNNRLSKDRHEIRREHGNAPEDHKCPICKRSATECQGEGNRRNGAWAVDHDHKTNQFRDWLCHSCNRNIGSFKDDTELLESAIEYLRKHKPA